MRVINCLPQISRDEIWRDRILSTIGLLDSHIIWWFFGWLPLLDMLLPGGLPIDAVINKDFVRMDCNQIIIDRRDLESRNKIC